MPSTNTSKQTFFSHIYQDSLSIVSEKFKLTCYCLECGWSEPVDLTHVEYETLNNYKSKMSCPHCHSTGLSISVTAKQSKN